MGSLGLCTRGLCSTKPGKFLEIVRKESRYAIKGQFYSRLPTADISRESYFLSCSLDPFDIPLAKSHLHRLCGILGVIFITPV